MKIDIETGEELNLLLEALKTEIINANSYHRLFYGLLKSRTEHGREFQQANTFWYLTLEALREARLISLCRIYDQNSQSLNLVNLLDTVKANLRFFSEPHFRERLQGNAFVDSLAKRDRIPKTDELECDIESVSAGCNNDSVKKLMIWRGNIAAHHNAGLSLGKNRVLENNPLSEMEIEKLLEHSLSIFNKYSNLYKACTHSTQLLILGHDDYKDLLKFINLGLQKWDEETPRPSGLTAFV
jgi:hypothetical protein